MLNKNLVEIPQEYTAEECAEKGRVERIDYQSTDLEGNVMDKYAFVYVPYGYDPDQEYEILYLIHGGGEDAEKYLYKDGEENPLKRAVDHLIANKEIKPSLIVTPSWLLYNDGSRHGGKAAFEKFPSEVVNDLIPAVESKYHTFAKATDKESLKESREHRAVIGWSMGSVTTWFVFSEFIPYFRRFGNMSGDIELVGTFRFDDPNPGETAEQDVAKMVEKVHAQNMPSDSYEITFVTGSKDFMEPRITPQIAEMKKYPDVFVFEGKSPNIVTILCEGGEHHTPWRLQYTYNVIKNYLKF